MSGFEFWVDTGDHLEKAAPLKCAEGIVMSFSHSPDRLQHLLSMPPAELPSLLNDLLLRDIRKSVQDVDQLRGFFTVESINARFRKLLSLSHKIQQHRPRFAFYLLSNEIDSVQATFINIVQPCCIRREATIHALRANSTVRSLTLHVLKSFATRY
jgi:hypothetical protein